MRSRFIRPIVRSIAILAAITGIGAPLFAASPAAAAPVLDVTRVTLVASPGSSFRADGPVEAWVINGTIAVSAERMREPEDAILVRGERESEATTRTRAGDVATMLDILTQSKRGRALVESLRGLSPLRPTESNQWMVRPSAGADVPSSIRLVIFPAEETGAFPLSDVDSENKIGTASAMLFDFERDQLLTTTGLRRPVDPIMQFAHELVHVADNAAGADPPEGVKAVAPLPVFRGDSAEAPWDGNPEPTRMGRVEVEVAELFTTGDPSDLALAHNTLIANGTFTAEEYTTADMNPYRLHAVDAAADEATAARRPTADQIERVRSRAQLFEQNPTERDIALELGRATRRYVAGMYETGPLVLSEPARGGRRIRAWLGRREPVTIGSVRDTC